jgi:hypothetical protein
MARPKPYPVGKPRREGGSMATIALKATVYAKFANRAHLVTVMARRAIQACL